MDDTVSFTSLLFSNGINRNGNSYNVDGITWERFRREVVSSIQQSNLQHGNTRMRFVILDSIQPASQSKSERVNWKKEGF